MSSIDTKSIISSLMAIERRPQLLLQSRVTGLQRAQSAWETIGSKLTALKSAAEALAPTGAAAALISVSSDDPAIGVNSIGTLSGTTSASIEVTSLAAAHSVLLNDTFSSTTASDGGRELDLTIGGQSQTFTSADGTIGGLAAAVNAASAGVSARVLQTSAGNFQLVLTSTSSGAASAFTAGGGDWSGSTIARTGADALFKVDGVSLTRPSNTVTDVIDGVELTLKAVTFGPVGISASRDDSAIADKVQALVDAANSVLTTVTSATKASANASERGVLSTDTTAKRVADQLRTLVASGFTAGDGSVVPAADLGVSLTQDGAITFDGDKLRAALAANPERVLAALGRNGSSSLSGLSVTNVTAAATEGPRTVSVTRAAAQASMVGVPVPAPPDGSLVAMTVVTPGGTYSVSFTAGSTYAETAANLNAALRGVGAKVSASTTKTAGVDDGFQLTSDRYGSGTEFTVSGTGADDLGLTGTADDGVDAEVSINGQTYTAAGQTLVKDGLALTVSYTQGQLAALGGSATGTVRVGSGLSGRLSTIGAEGSSTGSISRAKTALSDRITEMESRISRWDDVLASREASLQKRFTAMDVALSKLQALSSSLNFGSTS